MTPRVNTVRDDLSPVEFHPKTLFVVTEKWRYKVLWGGRGGVKSWTAAHGILAKGVNQPIRVLCARENMNSIAESVHHLLESRIRALKVKQEFRSGWREVPMSDLYNVEKARIMGSNGTEIIFAGLRHNVGSIKSLEAVDIVWVEEADQVSKDSWETLIPTIRKPDSEIWVTFNPKLATDDTYKRFVLNRRDDAKVVYTSYLENPWLPEVLEKEAAYMKEHDHATYRHVWLGECVSEVEGAIFGEQMRQVDADGRLCSVPIDRTKPVDTFWDLGFGDTNAIWFMQPYGGWFNVVDYMEGNGLTVADWVVRLQQKGYMYGTDWLPHDGVDAMLHKRLTADASKSVEMLLRDAGRKVRVAPKLPVTDRINAARTVFPQCRIDATRCADGVQALRHYQWAPPSKVLLPSGASAMVPKREPLHDWASHAADGFCVLAVAAKHSPAPVQAKKAPPRPVSAWV